MDALAHLPCWTSLIADTDTRICLVDEDGVLVAANECAGLFFQRPADELLGHAYSEAYPECVRGATEAWLRAVFEKEAAQPGSVNVASFLLRGERWVSRARVVTIDERRAALCVAHVERAPTPVEQFLAMVAAVEDREVTLGPIAVLSDRELEVALLIAAGMADAEIARQLHRSTRTVHAHRRSIGKKLRVETRAEILRIMVDRGLVGLPEVAHDAETHIAA
jgi:DNA-binding NarL/FixJ family response regulator